MRALCSLLEQWIVGWMQVSPRTSCHRLLQARTVGCTGTDHAITVSGDDGWQLGGGGGGHGQHLKHRWQCIAWVYSKQKLHKPRKPSLF